LAWMPPNVGDVTTHF